MDMNGWDIRKTLQLGLKSNATIQEWLTSPIYYLWDEKSCDILKQFIRETANLSIYNRRYETLGKQAYKQIDKQSLAMRIKDYCYSIRATLALMWLDYHNQPPPMDMESLQQELNLNQEIRTIISNIIEKKSKANEKEKMTTNPKLNALIEKTLEKNEQIYKKIHKRIYKKQMKFSMSLF